MSDVPAGSYPRAGTEPPRQAPEPQGFWERLRPGFTGDPQSAGCAVLASLAGGGNR